jgi:GDSL-like Lipase/Acylhydrolase family/N-terminus of Esterase_SGNH_hydro-type
MIFQILIALLLIPTNNKAAALRSDLSGKNFSIEDSINFYDGLSFKVIGKYHDEKNFGRFPARYKETLRQEVWNLGQNSAGLGIRFATNARTIIVRWTVMNESNLRHMPATGVRGVDLYTFANNQWQYVRTGFPSEKTTEYTLLSQGDGKLREYLLNLPLYDGVESLEIGVNEGATITGPRQKYLIDKKPVVYYGTSIAQGGCASRPGLAYTSILSRKLDREFINFGFSGNGTIETSVGEAMCEIDAALFVIDCNPNTKAELIYDRTVALVNMLRKQKPEVPILLIEGFLNESNYFNPASDGNANIRKKREELRRAFENLRKSGTAKLYYKKGDGLIGMDHEGTVDGIHPNDIGMMRMADALFPVLKKLL